MKSHVYDLDDLDDFYDAHEYIDRLSEGYIKSLSISLNKLHNKEEDEKYWSLIIGFWLKKYLSVLYSQYSFVKLSKDVNLVNSIRNEGIPVNGECYADLCVTSSYIKNLRYLISSILLQDEYQSSL